MDTNGSWLKTSCFSDAVAFVEALRPTNKNWLRKDGLARVWFFRGQRDAAWEIIPSAHRKLPQSDRGVLAQLREETWKFVDEWSDRVAVDWQPSASVGAALWRQRLREMYVDVMSELLAVQWFALLADDVGHQVKVPPWLYHINNFAFDYFRNFIEGGMALDDVFAIAQHHGVPTRLLDWSLHPLVAAYFAAEQYADCPGRSGRIAVWALNEEVLNCDGLIKRFSVPRNQLPFFHAQHGSFTWCPDNRIYPELGEWPSIAKLVARMLEGNKTLASRLGNRPALIKYELEGVEVPRLLKILWLERISRAHLMPTFDNVAVAMNSMISWRNATL